MQVSSMYSFFIRISSGYLPIPNHPHPDDDRIDLSMKSFPMISIKLRLITVLCFRPLIPLIVHRPERAVVEILVRN